MELKNSILEKITSLYDLLSKIDKYWTQVNFTKSTQKYNSMELEVSVYTFLGKEEEKKERIIAHIIKEKIDLMESIAEQKLDCLLEDVMKLVSLEEEEDTKCQTN